MTTRDDVSRHRLSSGHEITLPLTLSFTAGGLIVPARRRRLARALPSGLTPLTLAPGVGCVFLAGIQYHRVGHVGAGDTLEPYNEFGALILATGSGPGRSYPLIGALGGVFDGTIGGYVHWLPVTTEASVALGRELWGYPKELADVTVTDGPNGIRTGVSVDGETVLRFEVTRPALTVSNEDSDWTTYSDRKGDENTAGETATEGTLVGTRLRLDGEIGVGPPVGTTLELGTGEASRVIRELGVWNRPLARLYGSRLSATFSAGEPVPGPAAEETSDSN